MKLKKVKPGIIVEGKSLDGSVEFIGEIVEVNSKVIHVNEYFGKEVIEWVVPIDQVSLLKKVSKRKLINAYLSTKLEQSPTDFWITHEFEYDSETDCGLKEEVPNGEPLASRLARAFDWAELGDIDHDRFGDGSGAWVEVNAGKYSFVIGFDNDDETITDIALYENTVEKIESSDRVVSIRKGEIKEGV